MTSRSPTTITEWGLPEAMINTQSKNTPQVEDQFRFCPTSTTLLAFRNGLPYGKISTSLKLANTFASLVGLVRTESHCGIIDKVLGLGFKRLGFKSLFDYRNSVGSGNGKPLIEHLSLICSQVRTDL